MPEGPLVAAPGPGEAEKPEAGTREPPDPQIEQPGRKRAKIKDRTADVVGQISETSRLVVFDALQWAIEVFHEGRWTPRMYFHTKAGLRFYGVPESILAPLEEYFGGLPVPKPKLKPRHDEPAGQDLVILVPSETSHLLTPLHRGYKGPMARVPSGRIGSRHHAQKAS